MDFPDDDSPLRAQLPGPVELERTIARGSKTLALSASDVILQELSSAAAAVLSGVWRSLGVSGTGPERSAFDLCIPVMHYEIADKEHPSSVQGDTMLVIEVDAPSTVRVWLVTCTKGRMEALRFNPDSLYRITFDESPSCVEGGLLGGEDVYFQPSPTTAASPLSPIADTALIVALSFAIPPVLVQEIEETMLRNDWIVTDARRWSLLTPQPAWMTIAGTPARGPTATCLSVLVNPRIVPQGPLISYLSALQALTG